MSVRRIAIAAMAMLPSAWCAPVFLADYDSGTDAVMRGAAIAGELLPDAALTRDGLVGGGLQVGVRGGVAYPSDGFPIERGGLQMWVKAGFTGTDDVRRWFFCDAHERFKVFKYTNGHLYFQVRADEGGRHAHAPINWEPGEWHHIACLWDHLNSGADDATLRLYVDGMMVAAFRGRLSIPTIGPRLFLGCDSKGQDAAESVIDQVDVLDEPRLCVEFPPHLIRAHDPEDYALSQLGATATASTQVLGFKGKDYPAEAVIDGSVTGAYWASDFIFKTAKGPQWVEVDLGQPREAGMIKVHMMSARVGTLLDALTVSVLSAGEWKTVAQVKDYQAQMNTDAGIDRFQQAYGVVSVEFGPLALSKVRVDVPVSEARIREIEVLPPRADAAPLAGRLEDPDAVNVFDFGSNASTVAEGCLPVTETSTFTESSGYGWTAPVPLLGVERGQGYALTRDFVACNQAPCTGRFRVRLPDGDYAVGIIAGDTEFEVQPFNVDIENGQATWRVATADRCEAARFNTVVHLTDGALDIELRAEKAWLLSALVVAPKGKLAEVDAQLTQIEHLFAFGDPGMLKGLTRAEPEPVSAVAVPGPADTRRGYQLFVPSGIAEQVWPDLPPAKGSVATELRAWCTAGEYEPVTLAVHALRPLRDVRVQVSDLRGSGTVPADATDIRVVHCWPQRYKSQRQTEWAVMPELLRAQEHTGEVWVAPGTNRQWWLTLHPPEDAAAGEYRGTVTIGAADAEMTQLPLILTVYPFKLQCPAPMAWGIYYYPDRSQPRTGFMSQDRLVRMVRADLRDIREHGLNTIALSSGRILDWSQDPPVFTFDELKWTMALVLDAGFSGPFPVYMSSAWKAERSDREEVLRRFVHELEQLRRAQGWPELLYYPVDEPFGGQKLDEAVLPYQALAGIDGIRTYCTVSQEAAERLAPYLDIRCHATSAGTGYWWPSVLESATRDGDEFWWYSNCTREYPAVMRFKAGLHHWKSRATGQSYWHYRAAGISAFCDFDSGPGDHITSYPGVDGPVPTLQWECHREGIDDARYAYTLERLLGKVAVNADAERAAAARAGAKVLQEIRDQLHIDLHYYEERYDNDLAFHYVSDWPPARYDRVRREIAQAIVRLLAAGARQ